MTESSKNKYSEELNTKKILFFTLNSVISGFLFAMWGQIQFFAAAVLLIPLAIIPLIYLFYSIIDGINDPIIGYLTDRSKKFTLKFGKRFPWILIGVIFSPILLLLCFIPISSNLIVLVIWICIMMVLFESSLTLYEVNHSALFPDLFRDPAQRRKVSGIGGIIGGIIGIIAAVMIPLFIANLGGLTVTAYIGTVLIVIIIVYILIIPYSLGVREPVEMKKFRAELDVSKKASSSVKEVLTCIFKDKNWMAIIIANFCWAIAGACSLYGLNYFVTHYLGLSIGFTAYPLLFLGTVSFLCVPIWIWISKKIGVRKAYTAGLSINIIAYFLFFFVNDLNGVILVYAFAGIGYSATYGVLFNLLWAEGIDNAAVKTCKREEGSYNGILRVFSAFSYFFQTLIFAIVAIFSGYNPALGTRNSEIAKFGLKLQMSIIPMIILLIGAIIFVLMYKISKEDAIKNKEKLIEMGL
jgi:GPH family glycoside/pentoside/hexuronide:cation symporter